jgi:hypothetical protein
VTMTQWLVDPWTVYGDVRSDIPGTDSLQVAIPDVGILPPAGRYIGEVAVNGGAPVDVAFTVPARSIERERERRLSIDLPDRPVACTGSRVTVRFRGVETGSGS